MTHGGDHEFRAFEAVLWRLRYRGDAKCMGDDDAKLFSVEDILEQFRREQLSQLEASEDGERWFSAVRFDPGIRYDVFLSCSSGDYELANRLAKVLKRKGLRPYLAPEVIRSSDNFQKDIFESLASSYLMVVILSQRVYARPRWVEKEFNFAENENPERSIPIIPFIIDQAAIPVHWLGMIAGKQRVQVRPGEAIDARYPELMDFVFHSLGKSAIVLKFPERIREVFGRLWRTKRISIFLSIAIFAGIVFAWRTIVSPSGAVRGVIVVSPNNDPATGGPSVEAIWKGVSAKADDGIARSKVNLASRDLSELSDSFVRSFVWDDGGKPEVADEYRRVFGRAVISENGIHGIFRIPLDFKANAEHSAEAVEAIAKALEGQFLRVASENFLDVTSQGRSTHDAKSYTVVHVNRHRMLYVWPRQGAVRNFFSMDLQAQELTRSGAVLARLKDIEEQKGPSTLANRVVVLCGEVPIFTMRTFLQSEDRNLEVPNSFFDAIVGAHKLGGLHYKDAPRVLNAALSRRIQMDGFGDDALAMMSLASRDEAVETSIGEIEAARQRITELVSWLQITENSRDVVLIPFVY